MNHKISLLFVLGICLVSCGKGAPTLTVDQSDALPFYTRMNVNQLDATFYLEYQNGNKEEVNTGNLIYEGEVSTAGKHTITITTKNDPVVSANVEVDVLPTKLEASAVPEEYEVEATHHGTVEKLEYKTKKYNVDGTSGEGIDAYCYMYLPYDYDRSKNYNILYLMHGGGDAPGYWFGQDEFATEKDYTLETAKVLDNLFEQGVVDDLIICTPTFYNQYSSKTSSKSYDELYAYSYEFKNDLVPAVESTYSTYAENTSYDALKASRNHRAYAGLSMGSCTGFTAILCNCLDVVSYVGTFSGSKLLESRYSQLIEQINTYGIDYWYNGNGQYDIAHNEHLEVFKTLYKQCAKLKYGENRDEGDNVIFVDKAKKNHEYNSWIVDLYNCLLLFF